MNDSTKRFSDRVEDYVKYRPGYPSELADYLHSRWGLDSGAVVADVGAGTGISSSLFLRRRHPVFAIEPNTEMREKAIELLGMQPLFSALNGTAESTGLDDETIDLIVAGQAFHWFDQVATRKEFQRILKPGGVVALIWNERLTEEGFAADYDSFIIRHATDYTKVDHRNISPEEISQFFSPHICDYKAFPNSQTFDMQGLLGRLASSSYIPPRDTPEFKKMEADLYALFHQYQLDGIITIRYETKVFSGRLK